MAALSESCGSCQVRMDGEDQQQLAFAGASVDGLVVATSRRPFHSKDVTPAVLNVEVFTNGEDWPIILFVHGICESAETWSVQRLASACLKNDLRLFVLELEGHGLSSGKRAVCGDFNRLLQHVIEFVGHIAAQESAPYVLCGTSFGGLLAAYAADHLSRSTEDHASRFLGAAAIAPAVGVDSRAVPSCLIVEGLKVMATVAPSAGFMTPFEDPSHYACPQDSKRNFCGHWPLGTSKMLLDVTSKKVRADQESKSLSLNIPSLLVVAASEDTVVPLEAIQDFYGAATTQNKEFVEVPKAHHGLMFEEDSAAFVIEKLFSWLRRCLDERK
mmetsp:Transcript_17649/g.51370  ORF Transcript_17649/g.51370 Transcript_17649/m.51370 type:complete len:329 (-) Transcript_17649:313-1299(-)